MTAFAAAGINCFDNYEGLEFEVKLESAELGYMYTVFHSATASELAKGSGYWEEEDAIQAAKDEINRMNTNYYIA